MSGRDQSWRHVYRWDLDKTYLDTHFDKLSRMVRIAFESAEDKRNIPGSAALLRELSAERQDVPPARVCIVSGSPRQMRSVLEKKLRSDGIGWHEFELKPQLRNIRRGRFRAIRDQVGYKLPLLLASRVGLTQDVSETLFGDDAEADTFIYCLYADVVEGKVDAV
jgi:phosphatidate phosphatase APP1